MMVYPALRRVTGMGSYTMNAPMCSCSERLKSPLRFRNTTGMYPVPRNCRDGSQWKGEYIQIVYRSGDPGFKEAV